MSQPPALSTIEFEWRFTPPDLFEDRMELSWRERTFVIDGGKVIARFETSDGSDTWPLLANELHQIVHAQFLAVQVLTPLRYTLSRPTYARVRPDGGRDFFVTVETGRINLKMGRPDVRTTDAAGKVVYDSRRERLARRRS